MSNQLSLTLASSLSFSCGFQPGTVVQVDASRFNRNTKHSHHGKSGRVERIIETEIGPFARIARATSMAIDEIIVVPVRYLIAR